MKRTLNNKKIVNQFFFLSVSRILVTFSEHSCSDDLHLHRIVIEKRISPNIYGPLELRMEDIDSVNVWDPNAALQVNTGVYIFPKIIFSPPLRIRILYLQNGSADPNQNETDSQHF